VSASGKSSNRRTEYARGRRTGTGHGIYAAAGKRARQAIQARTAVTHPFGLTRPDYERAPERPTPTGLAARPPHGSAGLATGTRTLSLGALNTPLD
jgi:hypothetical protein